MSNSVQSRLQDYAGRRIVARGRATDLLSAADPRMVAFSYLATMAAAEALLVWVDPRLGYILYLLLIFLLLAHAALIWGRPGHTFLPCLALAPLIRVVSLSLPLDGLPPVYWYLAVSVPIYGAVFAASRTLGIRPGGRGVGGWGLVPQLLFGLGGLLLGLVEYAILRPDPLIAVYSWQRVLIAGLILLFGSALLEELIFRGLMQRAARSYLGRSGGVIFVALIFTVLHLGFRSPANLFFVLSVGLLYGWFAARTGRLLGVTLSHWLINGVVYLAIPFLLTTGVSDRLDALDAFLRPGPAIQEPAQPQYLPTLARPELPFRPVPITTPISPSLSEDEPQP